MSLDCNDIQSRMFALQKLKHDFDTAYALALSSKEQGDLNESIRQRRISLRLKKRLEQSMQELRDILPVIHEEYARDILEKEVFGKEAIYTAFGIDLEETDIPPIPFTPKELEQAKQEGWSLILHVSTDNQGNPMTMKHIAELAQERMMPDEGVVLDIQHVWWLENKAFFISPEYTLKTEWKLVANSFVPDINSPKDSEGNYTKNTTNNNFIHQTRLLRDYAIQLGLLTKEQEEQCSDAVLKQLSERIGVDWDTQDVIDEAKCTNNSKDVTLELSQLFVNANFRRMPSEILYDGLIRFKTIKDRGHLENARELSNTPFLNGCFILFGEFYTKGTVGTPWPFEKKLDFMGVSLSRSSVTLS